MTDFWKNFVFLCNKKDKTPNGVCSELNFSNATATKWKNGSIPRCTTIHKIAEYFGVSVDYLLRNNSQDELTSAIGAVVRRLRGELSLREFAGQCGVAHTTIDNIEKGVDFRTGKPTETTVATLSKIARACDVPVSWIIWEAEGEKQKGGTR